MSGTRHIHRHYLMFPTPGYSLHPRPFDVSTGATTPRLLDRPRCNLSHGLNVKKHNGGLIGNDIFYWSVREGVEILIS